MFCDENLHVRVFTCSVNENTQKRLRCQRGALFCNCHELIKGEKGFSTFKSSITFVSKQKFDKLLLEKRDLESSIF